jgi:hypothetical protein
MDDMKARLVFDSPNMVVAFYDRAEKVHKGAHIEVRMRFETFTIYKKQIVALTQWRAIATTETVDTGLMWWHEYVGIHTWKSGIHSGFVAALKQRLIDTGGDDVLDMKNPVFDGG